MANEVIKRIAEVVESGTPGPSHHLLYDDGSKMLKTPASNAADAIRPVASEDEATAGADNTKIMTPLRAKQHLAAEIGVSIASKSQGDLANTALQSLDGDNGVEIDTTTPTAPVIKLAAAVLAALIPAGGLTGQALTKISADDLALYWKTPDGGGDVVAANDLADLENIFKARANLGDFETVADLQAATVTAAQVRLTTSGYSARGDGGPWQAIRVSTPGAVKPWHRQTTDGAYWQLDVSVVQPRHFGAVLDGVADDTAAIQAWADYAATFKVKAVGQPGTANIPTGQLVLTSNTTIEGGFLTLKRSTDTVLSLVKGSAVSNVRIRDLTLRHTAGMTSTTSAAMGLTTKNFNIGTGVVGLVVNQFVQISAVSDPRNYEIAKINSYSGGVLNVTAITSVGSGTYANWYIDSYPLNGDTAESNIAVYLVGCSKVWIENCVASGRFYNGFDSRNGSDIRFLENHVDGVVNRGIHMAAYSVVCKNNRCVGNGVYGNLITQYGINTSATSTGTMQAFDISGNVVENTLFQGIEMGGKAQWCGISDNKVFMPVGAGYGVGILVQVTDAKTPRSVTVTGNAVQGGEQCIAIIDSWYWSLTGNRVTSGQTGYYIRGSVASANLYGTISGNGADSCVSYAYFLSAAVLNGNKGHAVTGNSAVGSGTGFSIGSNNSDIGLVGNVALGNTTNYIMAAVGNSQNVGNV